MQNAVWLFSIRRWCTVLPQANRPDTFIAVKPLETSFCITLTGWSLLEILPFEACTMGGLFANCYSFFEAGQKRAHGRVFYFIFYFIILCNRKFSSVYICSACCPAHFKRRRSYTFSCFWLLCFNTLSEELHSEFKLCHKTCTIIILCQCNNNLNNLIMKTKTQ